MSYFLQRLAVTISVVIPLYIWLESPWYANFSMAMVVSLIYSAAVPPRD